MTNIKKMTMEFQQEFVIFEFDLAERVHARIVYVPGAMGAPSQFLVHSQDATLNEGLTRLAEAVLDAALTSVVGE